MFETLPHTFREYKLEADIRTLLLLQKAIDHDLIKTLGDVYSVLKGIVVKSPSQIGPFLTAFYDYFLNIRTRPGEPLVDAIRRSDVFRKWLDDNLDRFGDNINLDDLVNQFLDDVHLTSYDIKKIIDGKAIWDKDDGGKADNNENEPSAQEPKNLLDQIADYSDLSLEELLERMKQVMEQQKTKHAGGSHWIGTGGISPYGHGGAAKDGIRVGGSGGGKMARAVINDRNYYPVDLDQTLNDNNVDAALASLKGVVEETSVEKLDIHKTIDQGLKRGGLFLPEIINEKDKSLSVLLIVDNGGYSMTPFVRSVQTLFRKMKTRFTHDLEIYYFHNTIYHEVYTDVRRTKALSVDKLIKKNPDYRVFIIGDASMAPYELDSLSMDSYKKLRKHFKKIAWLNPENSKYWMHSFTIQVIKELIDMYPLSPKGIERAVRGMNGIKC